MDVARHNSNFAFTRRNNSGTVWPDQASKFIAQIFLHLYHIESGNAFGNADDNGNSGIGCFHDCVGGERRRHVNHRSVRAFFVHRIRNRIENRNAFVLGAALAGRYSSDDVRSILHHLLCMKRAFFSGDALDNQTGRFIDKYTHWNRDQRSEVRNKFQT